MSLGLSSDRETASVGLAERVAGRDWRAAQLSLERALAGWSARCIALAAAYVGLGYAVSSAMRRPLLLANGLPYAQVAWTVLLAYVPLALGWLVGPRNGPAALGQRCRRRLVSPEYFAELACAIVAVQATLAVFVYLQQQLPALNQLLYDSHLWRLDRWLHFGVEPGVTTSELARAHGLLPWLDLAHEAYAPVAVLVPLAFLMSTKLRPLRGRFFFAYCLLWMLASAVSFLWPSLGPVAYWPSRFWLEQAPNAQYVQGTLLQDYVRFRGNPSLAIVEPYPGLAALPSLQVGVLTLFAIASARWRALSLALWLATVVVFVASLALGWHHAVDGYAGALLAVVAWLAARFAVPTLRPDPEVARRVLPKRATIA